MQNDEEMRNTSSGHNRASLELPKLSGNQRSRINHLIDKLLVDSNNKASQHHGESRHNQKEIRAAQGARGSHDLNKDTSKSENSEDMYKSKMRGLMSWAYVEHGIKDPFQIKAGHIKEFFGRLIDNGYSVNGYEGYTKALSYFERVLEQYSTAHHGNDKPCWQLEDVRNWKSAAIDKEHHRAYTDVPAIIKEMSGDARTAAEIQFYCGNRVSDATFICAENWDAAKGIGKANSKGGQLKIFSPPKEVADKITAAIKDHGAFKIAQDDYRQALKEAVYKVGEAWESTHGIRCASAERYMMYCKKQGMTYNQALKATGEFLGHHRGLDHVTETYVQGISEW